MVKGFFASFEMTDIRSPFIEHVYQLVRQIPYGKVVSYGQIAGYIGVPRAARQVGWVLNKSEGTVDLPWWRVVNNKGYLSISGTKYHDKNLQRKLLIAEGIPVNGEFVLPMEAYRFRANKAFLKQFGLKEAYIEMVLAKYFSS